MSCRHDLALGTCTVCYPATGKVTPTEPGNSMDGPGAAPRRMPIVYVAGPFRGKTSWDIAENVRHAERFGLVVARLGAMPLIPHANTALFHGQLDDQFWLDGTLRLLEVSDAIAMIPRWRDSSGARAEREWFEKWGRGERIFYLDAGPVERVETNDDHGRLRAWVEAFRA